MGFKWGFSRLKVYPLIWSSSPLFANAWNSDWKEEEETDNIRFNFFNGLKVGYFAHCDVETVKRTNWKGEGLTGGTVLRDNFISALFCTRNFIASSPEGMKMKWAQWKSQNTHLKLFVAVAWMDEGRDVAILGSVSLRANHASTGSVNETPPGKGRETKH